MEHKFDETKYNARKQTKNNIENQPSSEIKNVPELKERVLKMED